MIETTIICKCDRCNNIISESEDMFQVTKSDVPKSSRVSATRYPIHNDGVFIPYYDQYKSYHICENCSKKLFDFMENKI
jgi:hypothetical protein